MTGAFPSLNGLRPNPDWAKLPLFDRKGWKRLPFGAFADSINERVEPANAANDIYVGLDDLDSGRLHIRRWGKGSDVIGTKLRFRKGDIIFGRRRAYQRKLAVAEMDGICSAHAMVVRSKQDVVLPEFLPFLMMSDRFMNRAIKISVGSLSPTINWTTLKHEQFYLPPLDQQRRIAEILWAVDGVAEAQIFLLESHRQYAGAQSRALFARGVNAKGQIRRKSDGNFKDTDIGPLPETWEALPILEFAVNKGIVNGPFGSDLLTSELQTDGVPVIYVRDIKPGRYLRVSTVCVTPQKAEVLSFCDVRHGDVLLAKVGEPPCDAAPYLQNEPAIVTQDVIRIRPHEGVDCRFLTGLLNSAFGRNVVSRITIGGGRMRVSLTQFKSLVFPKPPLDEQRRIGCVMALGDKFEAEHEVQLNSLVKLLFALCEQFAGGAINE